jgi:hypothetical protein
MRAWGDPLHSRHVHIEKQRPPELPAVQSPVALWQARCFALLRLLCFATTKVDARFVRPFSLAGVLPCNALPADSAAIRFILPATWTLRSPNAIAFIQGVSW